MASFWSITFIIVFAMQMWYDTPENGPHFSAQNNDLKYAMHDQILAKLWEYIPHIYKRPHSIEVLHQIKVVEP